MKIGSPNLVVPNRHLQLDRQSKQSFQYVARTDALLDVSRVSCFLIRAHIETRIRPDTPSKRLGCYARELRIRFWVLSWPWGSVELAGEGMEKYMRKAREKCRP